MLPQTRIDRVIAHAALHCGIEPHDILGSSRHRRAVQARQAVCVALRSCDLPLQDIASCIRRSDHTSIIYHIDQATERERDDPQYARLLRELCAIAQDTRTTLKDIEAWVDCWPRIKAGLRWYTHQMAESADAVVDSDMAIDVLDQAITSLKQHTGAVLDGSATRSLHQPARGRVSYPAGRDTDEMPLLQPGYCLDKDGE